MYLINWQIINNLIINCINGLIYKLIRHSIFKLFSPSSSKGRLEPSTISVWSSLSARPSTSSSNACWPHLRTFRQPWAYGRVAEYDHHPSYRTLDRPYRKRVVAVVYIWKRWSAMSLRVRWQSPTSARAYWPSSLYFGKFYFISILLFCRGGHTGTSNFHK